MKRKFRINSRGYKPFMVTFETDDPNLVRIIKYGMEYWMAKLAIQILPAKCFNFDEINLSRLDPLPDDQHTTKDYPGSLDSFPSFGDEITDSSAS